ncbi:MAG: SRPBCC family protein [Candidatus Polarisedimenticolia bacterium]
MTGKKQAGRRMETTVRIEAPVEAVWKALTDAEELSRWFPLQARVRPGADGSVWLSWGPPWEGESRITLWDPPRRLRTGWQFTHAADAAGAAEVGVDYILEGEGGRTTLRLVHSGFGEGKDWDDEFDAVRRGWRYELRSLRHYLERHRGTPRRVVWERVPLPVPVGEAHARLMGPGGLLREGSLAGLKEGDPYAFTTATGDPFRGTVLVNEAPDFAGTAENWKDGLFRLHLEDCTGVREAGLWLATWGVPEADLEGLRTRFRSILEALFPKERV